MGVAVASVGVVGVDAEVGVGVAVASVGVVGVEVGVGVAVASVGVVGVDAEVGVGVAVASVGVVGVGSVVSLASTMACTEASTSGVDVCVGVGSVANLASTIACTVASTSSVGAVNLVSRFERIRRIEAVKRERGLQRERIELSQTIHDTIAQSAYLIGLGLETAIELVGTQKRDELSDKLRATHALVKSTMWELRHPIDIGHIVEGRALGRVLRSHASTFATITSIPAEVVQSGKEPHLPMDTRRFLFSITHNAMTNALRHSNATKVAISLSFDTNELRLSISDDGVGLPEDYADRGHGFRNMVADATRMGGSLKAVPGELGRGTTVTCAIPHGAIQGGA